MELKQIKIYANQYVHLSSSLAYRGVRLMLRMDEWPLPSPTFVPSRGVYMAGGVWLMLIAHTPSTSKTLYHCPRVFPGRAVIRTIIRARGVRVYR